MKISEKAKELKKIWSGFQSARVFLTANNYRIFDYLNDERTAGWLSQRLNTDKRATEILLDALTGIGLLKKKKGMYSNSALASKFLVSGSPYYQGDILRHADVLWKNWSGLDKVLKTGKPYHRWHNQDAFILGMHNLAILKAKKVLKIIGLKGVKTALDLGGGPGTYAMEMARRGVTVTLFDRPETVNIAKRVIDSKINFIKGDFVYDEIGDGYDLILISQILHAYSEKDSINLIKKCSKALNHRGRVIIQEFLINEQRTAPLQSALFSVNMLVNTEAGRCYTHRELKDWLKKAGFSNLKMSLLEDSVIVEGRKG